MHPISEILKEHYSKTFEKHGASSKGVDWGDEKDVMLRYDKMMAVASYTAKKLEESSNSKDEEQKENWDLFYIDQQLIEWMTEPTPMCLVPRSDNG